MRTRIVLFALVILFGVPSLPGLEGSQLVPPVWAWDREPNTERGLDREQLERALPQSESPCIAVGTSGQDKGKQGQDKKQGPDQQKEIDKEVARLKQLGAKDKDIKVSKADPNDPDGKRTVEAEWTKDGHTYQSKKTFRKDGYESSGQILDLDGNSDGTFVFWQYIIVEGYLCGGVMQYYKMEDGKQAGKPFKVQYYDPKEKDPNKRWKDAPKLK